MDWDVADYLAAPMILLSLEWVEGAKEIGLEKRTKVDRGR